MLLTLLINGFRVPMFINMLITRLGIISPTLDPTVCSTMVRFRDSVLTLELFSLKKTNSDLPA